MSVYVNYFADFKISNDSGTLTQSSTITALSTNFIDNFTTPSTSISTQNNDAYISAAQSTDSMTWIRCHHVSAMRCARKCCATRGCSSFSIGDEVYQMEISSELSVEFRLVY